MAGTFRGHTFNALMQPNAVDDRPLAFRSTLAPFGTYANPDGSESFGFAWPAAVTEPINALQRLAQNSYTEDGRLGIPDPRHPENLSDMETLLWTGFGSNALKGTAGAALRPLQQPTILEQYHAANNLPHPGYGYLQEPVASTAEDALRWMRKSGPIIDGELLSDTGKPSLMGAAVAGENARPGITAYHGSPHDFDKFSLDKIGTGEGAQAYGHGLYFAENEGVARSYRDQLGSYDDAVRWTGDQPPTEVQQRLLSQLKGSDVRSGRAMDVPMLKRELAMMIRDAEHGMFPDEKRAAKDRAQYDELLRMEPNIELAPPGHMYQVRINANPEDFLDWDKPLRQQSEKARNALAGRFADDPVRSQDLQYEGGASTPSYILRNAADAETTKALREAGIPGIKYLDQTSRTAGEGARNYVVFDDSLIEILKKYGLAGGAIGASSLFDFNTENQF